jgi:hypothetical protein
MLATQSALVCTRTRTWTRAPRPGQACPLCSVPGAAEVIDPRILSADERMRRRAGIDHNRPRSRAKGGVVQGRAGRRVRPLLGSLSLCESPLPSSGACASPWPWWHGSWVGRATVRRPPRRWATSGEPRSRRWSASAGWLQPPRTGPDRPTHRWRTRRWLRRPRGCRDCQRPASRCRVPIRRRRPPAYRTRRRRTRSRTRRPIQSSGSETATRIGFRRNPPRPPPGLYSPQQPEIPAGGTFSDHKRARTRPLPPEIQEGQNRYAPSDPLSGRHARVPAPTRHPRLRTHRRTRI